MTSSWATASRVAIVAGKGGVGSTTAAAVMATVAARHGADVLLVALDGRPGLGTLLGGPPLTDRAEVLCTFDTGGRVRGRTMPAEGAFDDYLALRKVNPVLRRAASAASLDVLAAATPGLQHLLVLGKIKELDRERAADVIVVDAPPAGHAVPFLESPEALADIATDGAVRRQADEVLEMLRDEQRCRTVLVTLAEQTPVTEVVELADDIGGRLGHALGPVIVNGWWPERSGVRTDLDALLDEADVTLDGAARAALDVSSRFAVTRLDQQADERARLDRLDRPVLHLPRLPVARLGPDDIDTLADAVDVELEAPTAGGGS